MDTNTDKENRTSGNLLKGIGGFLEHARKISGQSILREPPTSSPVQASGTGIVDEQSEQNVVDKGLENVFEETTEQAKASNEDNNTENFQYAYGPGLHNDLLRKAKQVRDACKAITLGYSEPVKSQVDEDIVIVKSDYPSIFDTKSRLQGVMDLGLKSDIVASIDIRSVDAGKPKDGADCHMNPFATEDIDEELTKAETERSKAYADLLAKRAAIDIEKIAKQSEMDTRLAQIARETISSLRSIRNACGVKIAKADEAKTSVTQDLHQKVAELDVLKEEMQKSGTTVSKEDIEKLCMLCGEIDERRNAVRIQQGKSNAIIHSAQTDVKREESKILAQMGNQLLQEDEQLSHWEFQQTVTIRSYAKKSNDALQRLTKVRKRSADSEASETCETRKRALSLDDDLMF